MHIPPLASRTPGLDTDAGMASVTLNDQFFAELAGWDAVKQARSLLAGDCVFSSNWTSPILKGVVQEGSTSLRAGLVIRSERDVENLCTCRASREWGTICAHSVAVGLHHLRREQAEAASASAPSVKPKGAASTEASAAGKTLRRAADGEPADLFIILPPNLEPAISRGKVMLVFEAKSSGGRAPLNVLPKNKSFAFPPQDDAVIERVELLAGGETPAMVMLGAKDFVELLPLLVGHPRLTLGKQTAVEVCSAPWTPPLRATLEANGEIVLSLAHATAPPVRIEGGWVYRAAKFQPLGLPVSLLEAFRAPVRLSRAAVPAFLNTDWPRLRAGGNAEANFKTDDFVLEPQAPRFVAHFTGGLARLQVLLQCAYGARILTLGVSATDETVWLPDAESPTKYSTRDTAAERAAIGRLLRAGFAGPDAQGRYQLLGQERVLSFFAREFPRLQREWQVTLEERLDWSMNKNLERIEPGFEVTSSGVQWFDLGVSFAARSGEQFSHADIQRLILSGQSHARLRNGKIALIDTGALEEWQEALRDCAPEQQGGRFRVPAAQAGFIEATVREQTGWTLQAPQQWREQARLFSGEAKPVCPPLGALETVLRPYQKAGVAWLHFLRENQFGGILADEMGLGKTLQVLALLNAVRAVASMPQSATRSPHLIVCPTSLVFNWVAEAHKFTPELRVLALHGPDRHALLPEMPRHDVIVTSYALLRRDLEKHRAIEFDTVVLDEAQHIKNRQTQNAQAVKGLRARHRLVLTGTPLENSVLDLWSIFDFLMPGYLGSARDFRERYEAPISRAKDDAAQARLARRLRPFLLRRLKRDVVRDLPEKIEQVSFCELTDAQREVYGKLIEASRKEVLDAVGALGIAKSRLVILNALLRLRQVCCDLRLLKLESQTASGAREESAGSAGAVAGANSGKLDLFGELLDEALDGGHRVLVFSQFVSMLTLLRERLAAAGIDYCYLDGATRDRAAVVQRFQNDPGIPVFLISLKAGGVGLNLTGADTVFHFDPWWNPAVEDQATDRAHRLGQTRVVTSYKLIARGTVEEKILALQQRKREVVQATLGEGELAAALTWEEIEELFA